MAATAGVTASTGWQGVGGTAMMATAMPYVAALQLLAAWVQQSAASAAAIEQAYVTAKMAMIQVPVCTSNRATLDRPRPDELLRHQHSADGIPRRPTTRGTG